MLPTMPMGASPRLESVLRAGHMNRMNRVNAMYTGAPGDSDLATKPATQRSNTLPVGKLKAAARAALATTTNGTDLVGTIDGVTGVAAGNVLSGAVGSNAAGMSINVSSTAGGTVVVSNGVTNQFSKLLESVLKDDNALDLRITNLNSRAEALTTDKAQMERRLEAIEKRYRTQFSTLDALLADLTNTGNFLEQQMKNIPVPGASKK